MFLLLIFDFNLTCTISTQVNFHCYMLRVYHKRPQAWTLFQLGLGFIDYFTLYPSKSPELKQLKPVDLAYSEFQKHVWLINNT